MIVAKFAFSTSGSSLHFASETREMVLVSETRSSEGDNACRCASCRLFF